MKVAISLMVVMAVGVLGGSIIGGCESTSTSSNVITMTPSSVTLNASNLLAAFTVEVGTNSPLVLPLTWSVSDASLGTIISSAALTASYQSTGKTGANTVIARDQAEAEGAAAVIQQ